MKRDLVLYTEAAGKPVEISLHLDKKHSHVQNFMIRCLSDVDKVIDAIVLMEIQHIEKDSKDKIKWYWNGTQVDLSDVIRKIYKAGLYADYSHKTLVRESIDRIVKKINENFVVTKSSCT